MSATYSGRLRSCARLLAFGLVLTAAGCTSLIGSRGQQGTAPISPSAPPPRAADQKFAEILATFAMGLIADMQQDPDAVLTNCLKLIRLDPDNSPTYLRAALAYLQKKQPEQAISILQRLQHRKPRDPLPYIYLGILYETMDRSPEARRAYLKAVRLGSDDPVPYQRLASAYLDRGEHKRAVDVLKQGLARVRRKEPLLRSLAEIYLYQAQKATTPDDRRNALRQVIPVLQELTATTESHELSPFWQLAGAYADLGRYADALQVLRRTADLIRSDLIASEAVARWITTRDDRDKFIALMEKRLEDEPGDHLTRVWLAAVYRNVGEDEKALGCYEAALATSNAPEVAYTEMGRLLIQKHDSRAAEILRDGLSRFPRSVELHNLMAFWLFSQEKFAESLSHYQFVEDHAEPDTRLPNTAFRVNYALAALQAGETDLAARQLVKAMEMNPAALTAFSEYLADRPPETIRRAARALIQAASESELRGSLLFLAAFLQIQLHEFDKAYDTFQKLMPVLTSPETRTMLEQARVLDDLYFYYGMVAERTGRYREAVQLFEKCISINPEAAEALNYLAYMWAERGTNLVKAREYVERALSRDPQNPAYIDTLGWIYYMDGDYTNALREIQRAYEKMPEDPTVAEHLGDVHDRLGNIETAITFWKKSLEIQPDNDALRRKLRAAGVRLETGPESAEPPPSAAESQTLPERKSAGTPTPVQSPGATPGSDPAAPTPVP